MKARKALLDVALKEWLLVVSCASMVLTSIYARHLPAYSIREVEVLFLLFALFVAIHGLQRSGLISEVSQIIQKGRAIPLKLVATTFFLSMLVTNDVALIVIVPLTLSLDIHRKDLLVILEALAANAGSALTPLGNPQNLYIYWSYELPPIEFVATILPFSLFFLVILSASAVFISANVKQRSQAPAERWVVKRSLAWAYGMFLVLILLIVIHALPLFLGVIAAVSVLLFDRKALHIDYALLLTFLFLFGVADNMQLVLESEIAHHGHVFLFSALLSQFIGNVPTALLFANFTANWEALLWGTNTGGFGSLFGSLANLIAYKLYVSHERARHATFTITFLILGYVAFALSVGLYFMLNGMS